MKYLLDTHAILWFVWDDLRLSPAASRIVEDPANDILVSMAWCWELAIKCGTGKLNLDVPVGVFVTQELAANRFGFLPITLDHAAGVESLPLHHKDPFDRMLIVQSRIEGVPIISIDVAFDPYGANRIW